MTFGATSLGTNPARALKSGASARSVKERDTLGTFLRRSSSGLRIAILGAGSVGNNLAASVLRGGHEVVFGSRKPGEAKVIAGAKSATHEEASAWCEIALVAVPAKAVPEVCTPLAKALAGKIVVDTTNSLGFDAKGPFMAPIAGFPSVAHQVASLLPESKVFKAFNTVGTDHHADPMKSGLACDIPIAGDDEEAKKALAAFVQSMGFNPINAGPLRSASVLENLAIYWIHLANVSGLGRGFTLKALQPGMASGDGKSAPWWLPKSKA